MKRIICILLTVILASTCLTIPASAEGPKNSVGEKLTPALQEALDHLTPGPEPVEGLNIVVYFSDRYDTIANMPSWPESAAVYEYTKYIVNRNDELIYKVYEGNEYRIAASSYINYCLQGCVLIYDFCIDDLSIIESSEHVRLIDIYDPLDNTGGAYGKYNYHLQTVLKILGDDDYVNVWIGNAAHLKTVAEMPSWPSDKGSLEEFRNKRSEAYSEYRAYIKEVEDRFINEAFEGIEDAYFFSSGFGFMVGVAVKVSDLEKIASHDCVSYIEYNENYIVEPCDDVTDDPDLTYYQQKLLDQYSITDLEHLDYEELYYHSYDRDDKPYTYDWVLVYSVFEGAYADAEYDGIVGGRKLSAAQTGWMPFRFGFGIYNAEQDRFFDLKDIDFDNYNGLYEVWKEVDMYDPFRGVYENLPYFQVNNDGDADGDGEVSILDATKIQRVISGLDSKYSLVATSADVNGDGEVTILDATRIQRFKAEMCKLDGSCYYAVED